MNLQYSENKQDELTDKYLDSAIMELPKELIEFAYYVSDYIDNPYYYGNGKALLREFILSKEKDQLRELMVKYPGSIICPTCSGNGLLPISDTINIEESKICTTCKGKKIVIPQEKIITEYIPIDPEFKF